MDSKVLYSKLSYQLTGIFFKAHNSLDRFRSEKTYVDAVEEMFKNNGINYTREVPMDKSFEGEGNRRNIPDFIVEKCIIVDIKAKKFITKENYIQMQRYLNASKIKLGMIVNFRSIYLKPKRVVNYNNSDHII